MLGRDDGRGGIVAHELTQDHKPDNPGESERVYRCGGAVEPTFIPGMGFQGPARVWKARQQAGGLAVSRAFGDTSLNAAGVISEPETSVKQVMPSDRCVVLGSDGVWDYVTNQEAVEMAMRQGDVKRAATEIVAKARHGWLNDCGGSYVDDITAVVVRLDAEGGGASGGGGGGAGAARGQGRAAPSLRGRW